MAKMQKIKSNSNENNERKANKQNKKISGRFRNKTKKKPNSFVTVYMIADTKDNNAV